MPQTQQMEMEKQIRAAQRAKEYEMRVQRLTKALGVQVCDVSHICE